MSGLILALLIVGGAAFTGAVWSFVAGFSDLLWVKREVEGKAEREVAKVKLKVPDWFRLPAFPTPEQAERLKDWDITLTRDRAMMRFTFGGALLGCGGIVVTVAGIVTSIN